MAGGHLSMEAPPHSIMGFRFLSCLPLWPGVILPILALACCCLENYRERMKLQQGQTWKCGDEFVRIVDLKRLEVGYKSFKSVASSEGQHHRATKKAFCRLLKGATLLVGKPIAFGEAVPTAAVADDTERTG